MSNTSTSPSQNSRSAWSGGESALTEKRDLKQGVVKQFSNGRVLGVVRAEEFMACSRCLSPCGRSVPGKARTLHGRPGPPGLVLQVLFVCRRVRSGVLVGPGSDSARGWLNCCFTSTENVGLLRTRAQDVHLRLNTSIVLAAVHGLSGLFRAVSAVEPSLFRPLPPLSPSLISHLASVDVKQH